MCITFFIIFHVLYPYFGNDVETRALSDASVNKFSFICDLNYTTVVPWMMSKSQINAIGEENIKMYYNNHFHKLSPKNKD